mgnify:CR=1 FL=1
MQYCTLIGKRIHCSFWNIDLSISGKYKFTNNCTNPNEAEFLYGICPIIENNKLPEHKRNRTLVLYAFCKNYPCNELSSFKPLIDIAKDGYSQT